jgi:hypothetical protein
MAGSRYVEFDSTYRNRNLFPCAGEFEVPISETGSKGKLDALDPVSLAATKKQWKINEFSVQPSASSVTVTVEAITTNPSAASGGLIIEATAATGLLQHQSDYYSGAVAIESASNYNRIFEYTFFGAANAAGTLERGQFLFSSSFPTVLAPGDTFDITDPTTVIGAAISPPTNPVFFIPHGRAGDNAYVKCFLYNETQNESRPVGTFSGTTHLMKINTSGSAASTATSGPVTTWTSTDVLVIREALPSSCGTLDGVLANNPTTKIAFNLPSTYTGSTDLQGDFLDISNFLAGVNRTGAAVAGSATTVSLAVGANADDSAFTGCTIEMLTGPVAGQSGTITGYSGTTVTATVSPGFTAAVVVGNTYLITCPIDSRRIVKYVSLIGAATGSGITTSVSLPSSASNISGEYNDLYLNITSGAATGDIRLLRSYIVTVNPITALVTSRVATPYTAFSAAVNTGDTFEIRSGKVEGGAGKKSIALQNFCILPFDHDNFNPFDYTGSMCSQEEMVCYEMELLNVVLPNSTLNVGRGSLVSFYPYVYVEISNVSAPSAGMKNAIYSNNPNSTRMVFRAALDDVPNPIISSFVKIDGDGMVQTLKFKPNDNLRFSVKISSGEIYETLLPEHFSPLRPNSKAQISSCFLIRRIG